MSLVVGCLWCLAVGAAHAQTASDEEAVLEAARQALATVQKAESSLGEGDRALRSRNFTNALAAYQTARDLFAGLDTNGVARAEDKVNRTKQTVMEDFKDRLLGLQGELKSTKILDKSQAEVLEPRVVAAQTEYRLWLSKHCIDASLEPVVVRVTQDYSEKRLSGIKNEISKTKFLTPVDANAIRGMVDEIAKLQPQPGAAHGDSSNQKVAKETTALIEDIRARITKIEAKVKNKVQEPESATARSNRAKLRNLNLP